MTAVLEAGSVFGEMPMLSQSLEDSSAEALEECTLCVMSRSDVENLIRVRDRALTLALGEDAPAAEQLWTECTRRAPAPLDAAPATLLAVGAWLRGDGAMANVALERALDSRPTYTLARLLADGLAACLPPAELRAMLASVTADPDEVWAAG